MRFTLPGKSPMTELIWAMPMFMSELRKHSQMMAGKRKNALAERSTILIHFIVWRLRFSD
jgi:hypothetical protein